MTSPTAKSDTRRSIRKAKSGRRRKAALKNLGSTAAGLALNKPTANELAQTKRSNQAKAAKA
jgi:hypothetical protein